MRKDASDKQVEGTDAQSTPPPGISVPTYHLISSKEGKNRYSKLDTNLFVDADTLQVKVGISEQRTSRGLVYTTRLDAYETASAKVTATIQVSKNRRLR